MSNYLIELSVIHVALILGYWFFLRKEQQYTKMRMYLIGSTLLALIIPLLKLPKLLFSSKESTVIIPFDVIPLDAVAVGPAPEVSLWNSEAWIWLYLIISGGLLIKFLSSMIYLIYLERRSRYEKFNGLYLRKTSNIRGSFTFFNWIFLSDEINQNASDYEVILKHEKAHASLGHTYDLIFFELFRVCFWWLPTSWFINKEIKKIHEYQADACALKSYDIDRYSSILISSTLKSNGLSLASSFHDGLILKRLKAMKQQVKIISPWKLGALSALCALLFTVFACSEELDNEIKKMGSNSNTITFDQLPGSMQKNLRDRKNDLTFIKLDIPEGDDTSNILELAGLDPGTIQSVHVVKDKPDEGIYIAVRKEGANFEYLSEKSKISDSEGEIFTIVEDQPEYPGGLDAFYKYLAREMRYPSEARTKGIEGRVYVQFIVEKGGSLSDIKVVKGIGFGCDEEALRVMENLPAAFKPGAQRGKPVRIRMVLPIIFKLNEGKTNPDNSTQGTIIIDQLETNQNGQLKVEATYQNGGWTGTVYDSNGEKLPGASILVTGTTTGTISDLDGNFQVKTSDPKDLSVSFVGYESVRLANK